MGRPPRRAAAPARRSTPSRRTTAPRSRCVTSTTCRSPGSPSCSTARCTRPKASSYGPARAFRRDDGGTGERRCLTRSRRCTRPSPRSTPIRGSPPDCGRASSARSRCRRESPCRRSISTSPCPRPAPPSPQSRSRSRRRAPPSPTSRCRDGHAAIDWYVEVLGARLVGDPIVMDDGRVGHAELALGTRRDVSGRGVPRDRPRRATPERDVGQPGAARRRRRRHGRRGGRGRWSAHPRGRRGLRPPRRNGRRPVRPPLDAADPARTAGRVGVTGGVVPPRRHRLLVALGSRRRTRGHVLRRRPRVEVRAGARTRRAVTSSARRRRRACSTPTVTRPPSPVTGSTTSPPPWSASVRPVAYPARPTSATSVWWPTASTTRAHPSRCSSSPPRARRRAGRARAPSTALRHGDLCYLTLQVRDTGRARAFYGVGARAGSSRPGGSTTAGSRTTSPR